MCDLSISIVNTSNWVYLEPCLNSIINTVQNIDYEILVVDNCSDDNSVEKIKANFPSVILSVNKSKYGFAKNNNINLRRASGRYLMLLNDDTLVQPNSLENAIMFLDDHPEIGGIGCKMIDPDGSFQRTSARRLRTLYFTILAETRINRQLNKLGTPEGNSIVEIELPQEAGMILRKEVIDDIGLLDEQFFMFGEGADWCRRIKNAGWKIVLYPNCSIIHFGGVTNKKTSLKMYLQTYKSAYLYFKKESKIKALIYRLFIISMYTMKSFVIKFAKPKWKKKYSSAHEMLEYYQALVTLMLNKVDDPNYPFPTQ